MLKEDLSKVTDCKNDKTLQNIFNIIDSYISDNYSKIVFALERVCKDFQLENSDMHLPKNCLDLIASFHPEHASLDEPHSLWEIKPVGIIIKIINFSLVYKQEKRF